MAGTGLAQTSADWWGALSATPGQGVISLLGSVPSLWGTGASRQGRILTADKKGRPRGVFGLLPFPWLFRGHCGDPWE